MVDNPLYPGKPPKGNAVNPLYPGYFPGQALQRRPSAGGFIKPIEFNAASFSALLADEDIIAGPLRGPEWLRDRILQDWKDEMKASIKPQTNMDQAELADYPQDELPGASGISLSLNPEDWKDPKKYLKETATSWIKLATGVDISDLSKSNFTDFETRERAQIWKEALGFTEKEGNQSRTTAAERTGTNTLERNRPWGTPSPALEASFTATETTPTLKSAIDLNPVHRGLDVDSNSIAQQVKNSWSAANSGKVIDQTTQDNLDRLTSHIVAERQSVVKDYKAVADNVVKFQTAEHAAALRDPAYEKLLGSTLKALDSDLYGKTRSVEDLIKSNDPILQRILQGITATAVTETQAEWLKNNPGAQIDPSDWINNKAGDYEKTVQDKMLAKIQEKVTTDRKDLIAHQEYELLVGTRGAELLRNAKANGASDAVIEKYMGTLEKIHAQSQVAGQVNGLADAHKDFMGSLDHALMSNPKVVTGKSFDIFNKGNATNNYANIVNNINETRSKIQSAGGATNINLNNLNEYLNNVDNTLTKQITNNAGSLKNKLSQLQQAPPTVQGLDKAKLLDGSHIVNLQNALQTNNGAQIKSAFDTLASSHAKAKESLKKYIESSRTSKETFKQAQERILSDPSMKSYFEHLVSVDKVMSEQVLHNAPLLQATLKTTTGGGKTLTTGNAFTGTIQRSILQDAMEKSFIFSGGPGGDVSQIGALIGDIHIAPGSTQLALASKAVLQRSQVERTANAIEEFVTIAQKGPEKLTEVYIYNPFIKSRIENWTPAVATRKFLKSNHHFGLIIDENFITAEQEANAAFRSLHQYKFGVSVIYDKDWGGDGKRYNLKFLAGEHFKDIKDIHDFLYNDIKDKVLINAILSGRKLTSVDIADAKKLADMQLKIDTYLDWAASNKDLQKINKSTNGSFLRSLLDRLDREARTDDRGGLGITASYIGHLQRGYILLNQIQTKILNSAFGKLIKGFVDTAHIVRETVVNTISKFITMVGSKLVDALSAGALAGTSELVAKVLEPLIRFIVDKIYGYVETFFKGLLRGDLTALINALEKEVQQLVKIFLYIILAPLGCSVVVMLLITMFFSTLFSPIDPTKSTEGYTMETFVPAPPPIMRVTKDVVVTYKGKTVTNPSEALPEDAFPVKAKFKITIEALKDINSSNITYEDTTTAWGQDVPESKRNLFKRTATPVGPLKSGQIVVIDLPEIAINSDYKNSLINNRAVVTSPGFDPSTATGSRSFTIGILPIPKDCFTMDSNLGSHQTLVEDTLAMIASQGKFLAELCSVKKIVFVDGGSSGGFCGQAFEGNPARINLYFQSCPGVFSNQNQTNYIIAHELAHQYNYALTRGDWETAFSKDGKILPTYDYGDYSDEGGDCSALGTPSEFMKKEGFAELIGNYMGNGNIYVNPCSHTFSWSDYPAQYKWVQELFGN